MNDKVKSFLYFATLLISVGLYYNVGEANTVQSNEIANNTLDHDSSPEKLN